MIRRLTVRRFQAISVILTALGLAGLILAAVVGAQSRVMGDDVLEMLAKGFDYMAQSNFSAAHAEFEKVIKSDFDNPFANNNMAVLMEKQGRLVDAMTYLKIAAKAAENYKNRVKQAHLLGLLCAAVNPEKETADKSAVSQVIADNQRKLAEKMASQPTAASPEPGK